MLVDIVSQSHSTKHFVTMIPGHVNIAAGTRRAFPFPLEISVSVSDSEFMRGPYASFYEKLAAINHISE